MVRYARSLAAVATLGVAALIVAPSATAHGCHHQTFTLDQAAKLAGELGLTLCKGILRTSKIPAASPRR
ncbi:hypothetical protein [Myceligenerans pegani]|uniref:Uncharacterized protein n=1 Tax=Myceligenerans pegani TaxID=2776917 RepID=A0ABR9MWA8_9MICO|nr:hypothetical protein [Myceligenerans sp. TRM 65318]MBE1875667.1 hypothetical protein [Myceligenerans sp. TRM 65318]MBE3017938.1 hypothetical protein [Myceligenerans sp. TRM 65318]